LITAIERKRLDKTIRLYDLQIDETHTFCVTEKGLVVHNRSDVCGDQGENAR